MKIIPVNNGDYSAKVSDEDFDKLSKFKWYGAGSKKKYACRQFQKNRMKHYVYMHREVMDAPEDMVVDHINGDPLDNRRENLRICTHAENSFNTKKPSHNTSGYKGVHFYKNRNKYTARIAFRGKDYNLGYFETAKEAHAAYCAASKVYHGEYSRTN